MGAAGMFPWGIGGGGTRGACAFACLDRGGDSRAVLMVMDGGAFGPSLDGTDTLRG